MQITVRINIQSVPYSMNNLKSKKTRMMKKTIYVITMLVGSLMAVSCQSDSEYAEQVGQPMVINAKAEQVGDARTRVSMEYAFDVFWNAGDQICVRNNSANATFTLQSGAGTPNGTFSCASSPFASGNEVEAFYPQTIVDGGNLTWPADQTKNTVMPMYCKQTLAAGDIQSMDFKSLGGILQIVFMKNLQSIEYIKTIKIEDGEKTLSGTFTIDNNGRVVITATDKAGITVETLMDKRLGYTPYVINVALPAGTYNSLKFTFTDRDDRVLVRNVSEPVTISCSRVTKVDVAGGEQFHDISPSTGYAKATIEGKEVDVPWVRLWWKGPKFAAYNVGVTDGQETTIGGYYNWGGYENKYHHDEIEDYYSKGTTRLSGSDDTATRLWGSNWRMPTAEEMRKLAEVCDAEAVSGEGIRFTSRITDYSGNSVFFPLGDYISPTSGTHSPSSIGPWNIYCWTSDPQGTLGSCAKMYKSDASLEITSFHRKYGMNVRAVLNE